MGNKMGKMSKKYAKVMKINGEVLKFITPVKVSDVIKDYPGHVILDSNEFIRFDLRANPLEPDMELRPKKIYLLVQLPDKPLSRSVTSNSLLGQPVKPIRRSVSDLPGMTRSLDDGPSGIVSPTRVKVRLLKTVLERIMAESSDESDMAHKILRLYSEHPTATADGGNGLDTVAEDNDAVEGHCFKVLPSPHQNKYKRLASSVL